MKKQRKRPALASPAKRRKGGQPGNTNALTHGFYSHLFSQRERSLLDEQPITDLSTEIELIHIATSRFLESLANSGRAKDPEAAITALRLVNLSAQSIASLLRIQTLTSALRPDFDFPDDALAADDSPPPDPAGTAAASPPP